MVVGHVPSAMQGFAWLSRRAHQRRSRAVAKTVLYRAFMVVVTVVVAYAVTGQVADAVNIGVATNLVKTGTYYAYERVWDHVAWGTAPA